MRLEEDQTSLNTRSILTGEVESKMMKGDENSQQCGCSS